MASGVLSSVCIFIFRFLCLSSTLATGRDGGTSPIKKGIESGVLLGASFSSRDVYIFLLFVFFFGNVDDERIVCTDGWKCLTRYDTYLVINDDDSNGDMGWL